MSVPIRRPDFNAAYPSEEDFPRAMAQFAAVAMSGTAFLPAAPAPPIALPDASGLANLSSARDLGVSILNACGARVLSDHEGLVKMLLLSVPKGTETAFPAPPSTIDPRHLRHFDTLFRVFGNQVDYVIVATPDQRAEVETLLIARNITTARFVSSPHFNRSIWIQDAHVALRDDQQRAILLEGVAFNRFEDASVADDVAAQTKVRALQSVLYFQGGNVLGGSDVTLIGRDYLWRNTARYGMRTEADVARAFQQTFGTGILGLGGSFPEPIRGLFRRGILSGYGLQPIFHIDMYVTRTGVSGSSGREIVFLGRPAAAHAVVGAYSDAPELNSPVYDNCFDRTKADLETMFEVRTLPLWITYGNLGDRLKFYNLTWNNVMVENGQGIRQVLLPNYADPDDAKRYGVDLKLRQELQDAAAEAWRGIGFTVRFTDGMEDLAWGDGALHCMTKVLSRTM